MRERLTHLFFHFFFRLLIFVISCGQWISFAWLWSAATGADVSAASFAAGCIGMYVVNFFVIGYRRRHLNRQPGLGFRLYGAVAFTALFCFVFLAASVALWAIARPIVGSLHALTVPGDAAISAGFETEGAFRWFVTTGMGGIALLFGYGYVFGRRQLRVSHLTVPVRGWTGDRRLRIAQISDVHVGQNLSAAELTHFVARVNELQPDLICLTGDIADGPLADCARFFPILGELRAPLGVCAILGNHDHYAGADDVAAALERWTDFRVLRDAACTLTDEGRTLHVIGLDDRGRDWARGVVLDERLTRLLAAAPLDVPLLLLNHRPDLFPQAAAAGVSLMLAGHTHGGQLALPGFGSRRRNLADFITPFSRGLYEQGGSYLYVNCGLGVTGQPIRLFTPREIALIELRPA